MTVDIESRHANPIDMPAARAAMVAAARRLADRGLVPGSSGNLSLAEGEQILITPAGGKLAELDPATLAVVDADGRQMSGSLAPSSELALHLALHRRADTAAVIHTHPPMGTALGCVLDQLPVIHYAMLGLGGPIRVAPHATFGSERLATLTEHALTDRSAALMAGHGAVAVGPELTTALERTLLLEWLCSLLWHALAIGRPRELTEEEQRAVRTRLEEAAAGREPRGGRG